MAYYQGDFYQGDYYTGDPFFGALIGKVARGIGGLFKGRGATTAIQRFPGGGMAPMETAIEVARGGIRRVGGAIAKHPVLTAAGAAGTIGVLGGVGAGRVGMVPAGQKGFHISRRTGKMVRNRRMRVTNPKALRRAIRRCSGFSRLAMRVLRFTHPRRARGRPYFRRHTKKRA